MWSSLSSFSPLLLKECHEEFSLKQNIHMSNPLMAACRKCVFPVFYLIESNLDTLKGTVKIDTVI